MLRRNKVLFGLAILFVSSAIFMGSKVEANLDLFLGQFIKTKVEINGNMLEENEVPAFVVNDRSVIPLRQAAEMLNAIVQWDEGRRVVKVTKPIVNMSRFDVHRTTIVVNDYLEVGKTHSFYVATQVSKVPVSKNLKTRFIVVDSNNKVIREESPFTIDTTQFNGGFNGNLEVANLSFSSKGEYILKLQIENPDSMDKKFITIGEHSMIVR